jgi:hypothetical protein
MYKPDRLEVLRLEERFCRILQVSSLTRFTKAPNKGPDAINSRNV